MSFILERSCSLLFSELPMETHCMKHYTWPRDNMKFQLTLWEIFDLCDCKPHRISMSNTSWLKSGIDLLCAAAWSRAGTQRGSSQTVLKSFWRLIWPKFNYLNEWIRVRMQILHLVIFIFSFLFTSNILVLPSKSQTRALLRQIQPPMALQTVQSGCVTPLFHSQLIKQWLHSQPYQVFVAMM